ncbi:hypothetical protein ACTA71_006074 [Dictyostelium dimigraforme]
MATLFDILNTINNHSNYYSTKCKRQKSNNNCYGNGKRVDIIPLMDVTVTDDSLMVETELAGISKDRIEVDIKDSILTIQGEKINKNSYKKQISQQTKTNNLDEPSIEEFEEEEDRNNFKKSPKTTTTTANNNTLNEENKTEYKKYLSERSYGNFKRCLDLTNILYQLDLSTIESNFENGLLTITIKKKSNISNSFKININ